MSEVDSSKRKLILVDAHGYLHRAFHALPPLTTSKGEPVNAVYGFIRMILKLLQDQRPDYFIACFDSPGPTFRHKIYPEYKATRKETDENLKTQFPIAHEVVQAMGLALLTAEGFEADDLIATVSHQSQQNNLDVLIVSGDKDILQLVNEKIKVLNEPKQTLFDSKTVLEKWGIHPPQIVDVLALMGDSSDNVPGVSGIGEKTAVKLIQDYGSVEKLLQNKDKLTGKMKDKIMQSQDQILQSRKLCTLRSDVPIQIQWPDCMPKAFNQDTLVPLFRKLEFNKLVTDLFAKGMLSTPKEDIEKFSQNYETILTQKQLDQLVKTLSSCQKIAIDVETTGLNAQKSKLVGISVSWKKEFAAYIPLRHHYLGAPQQLDEKEVFRLLKPILENETIQKVGQNLKFDFSFLIQAGIRMKNLYFDTMLASYCLDPARNSHGLKELVPEFLGRNMTHIEELVQSSGRGKLKKMDMDQVEIDKVSPYACADADCTLQLADHFSILLKEKKIEELFYEVEMPLVEILADMELRGIKVNTSYLEELDHKFSEEIQGLERRAHELAGQDFNLNSSKQLAFILFEKLKLPTSRKTKTGFSTDEEVLSFLSTVHELPKVLLKHRELAKLKSTYIEGLLAQVHSPDLRIHTSFNQTGTATGRLSSNDPNLQNIPIRTEYGRMIRRAFVTEKDCTFLAADYSQIDLRVLAHLSQDPVLCKAFRDGADIHRATASEVFHVPSDQVTEEERKKAKAINFGIVYGQQSYGLSRSLSISVPEAQDMIDHYFQKYAGVKEWIENTKQQARKDGYVKTLLGRIRYLNEINSKNMSVRAFAERLAINTPVQGTSADIIKVAMIKINSKFQNAGSKLQAQMLIQVHDDLLFEVFDQQLMDLAKIVKENMENAIALSIPILVDLKQGKNWADMQPLKMTASQVHSL